MLDEQQQEKLSELRDQIAKEVKVEEKKEETVVQKEINDTKDSKSDLVSKSEDTTTRVQEEPQYNEEEKEAIANGWKPDFNGPNKVSAYEFNRFGKMLDHQNKLKEEINGLKDVVKQQIKHGREVEKAAYLKALREIEQRRKEAVQLADEAAFENAEREVVAISQEIDKINQDPIMTEVKEEPKSTLKPQEEYVKSEAEVAFETKHKDWLHNTSSDENKERTETAYVFGQTLVNKVNRGELKATPSELLEKIETKMRALYPHRFKNQNKERPAAVASPSSSSEDTTVSLASRLSERQLSLWKEQNRIDKSFTKEEYAKQLDMVGALAQ